MSTACQDDRYIIALYSEDEDGAVTDRINLADGASYGVGPRAVYAPPPSQKISRGADSVYRHGADVVRVRYNNSTVEIRELTILGTAEILAERIMRITTMLEKARLRQERGWGEKVFIERDWRHSTYHAWDIDPVPEYFYETVDMLRKEVYRGEFIPPREDVGGILKDGVLAPCRLNLECYPFWQGRERNIVLDYTVENHHCDVYPPATRNWVNLDAADLPGDAPCLLRIKIRNVTGANEFIRRLRAGVKVRGTPHTWEGTYQSEDGVPGTDALLQGGVDFSCQSGIRITPTGIGNSRRVYWTIGGDDLQPGTYRILIRARNNTAARTVQLQHRLLVSTAKLGYQIGKQKQLTTFTGVANFVVEDLGLVVVPPGISTGYDPFSYLLEILGQSDVAAGTYDLDYVMLLPVEGGSKLIEIPTAGSPESSWPNQDYLYFDGFVDPSLTYIIDWQAPLFYYLDPPQDSLGNIAYVQPGRDYRLFLSADQAPNWFGADDDLRYNSLDTIFHVSIDIIPQHLYIR